MISSHTATLCNQPITDSRDDVIPECYVATPLLRACITPAKQTSWESSKQAGRSRQADRAEQSRKQTRESRRQGERAEKEKEDRAESGKRARLRTTPSIG